MKVKGYSISESIITACLEVMRCGLPFRVIDIKATALKTNDTGGPGFKLTPGLAERLADRLVQQEKKAGMIKASSNYPYWEAVKEPNDDC